jgi:L-rhamnose isomerase
MGTEELNEHADSVKASVIGALVQEKLLNVEIADEWAKTHTVIMTQKTFFRSVWDKICKKADKPVMYYQVVKTIPIPDRRQTKRLRESEGDQNGD